MTLSPELDKITKQLRLARNIALICVLVILYNGYQWGFSIWSLIYLLIFIPYSFLIPKGYISISALGVVACILFSVSYFNLSREVLALLFIAVINYGFLNGFYNAYKLRILRSGIENA